MTESRNKYELVMAISEEAKKRDLARKDPLKQSHSEEEPYRNTVKQVHDEMKN